ncbi:MAG: hypothetical protein IID44_09895 [Planctomycetes bacterium]|nr:hypothetical protein [Planctomycetota bacterium]
MNDQDDQLTTPPYVEFSCGGDSITSLTLPHLPRLDDRIRIDIGDGVKDYVVASVVWHFNKAVVGRDAVDVVSRIEVAIADPVGG